MTPLNLAVAVLALWRVASLLVRERGPFDVFVRLRRCAGISHDDEGVPESWPDTWAGNVLTCLWCCSMNLALVYALLWFLLPGLTFWLSLPFALSAGAIIIDRLMGIGRAA